jgi:prolipoprotein diacylglyceryltransferase
MRNMICQQLLARPLDWLNREPVWFRGRSFHVVYFGLFAAANFFLTASLIFYYPWAKGHGFRLNPFAIVGAGLLGNVLAIKLYHAAALGRKFLRDPKSSLNQTAMYNQAGIIGVFCALVVISRLEQMDLRVLLDGAAFGAALGLTVGRLGCYNYGCCFGRPTESTCAVRYSNPNAKVLRLHPDLRDVPLVPTQLYAAAANLLLVLLFAVLVRGWPYDGLIVLVFVVADNVFRVLIQRYRAAPGADEPDYSRVALCMLGGGLVFLASYALLTGRFLPYHPFENPLSLEGYVRFLASDWKWPAALLTMSLGTFLFFGVHGRTLGRHLG